VSAQALAAGLKTVHWPGRFQQVERPGGGMMALDGAHNPAGAAALRATLESLFPGQRPTLILGVLLDKDWAGLAEVLAPVAKRILVVPVKSARALSPELLAQVCRQVQPAVPVDTCGQLEEALRRTEGDPLVVVAGSLYLVGEALEHLGLSAVPPVSERGLNEWVRSASPSAKKL
jgi:dihydrofolate synthase/folylpolyglutamate synthase